MKACKALEGRRADFCAQPGEVQGLWGPSTFESWCCELGELGALGKYDNPSVSQFTSVKWGTRVPTL